MTPMWFHSGATTQPPESATELASACHAVNYFTPQSGVSQVYFRPFLRSARRARPASSRGGRFRHAYRNVHPQKRRGRARIRAPQRQHLLGVPSDRDTNQIAIADDAVGGIEVDPASAGQVRLHPRVGGSAAKRAARIGAWHVYVPADKASGQTQRTRALHHQNREIPATAAAALQRLVGTLHSLLTAAFIQEVSFDAEGHGPQQVHGPDGPAGI